MINLDDRHDAEETVYAGDVQDAREMLYIEARRRLGANQLEWCRGR